MVGSLSGTGRANGLRQDLDVGPHQDVEDREVAHTVKDKSLEEMASDLRSLSGQIVTARVMGVGVGGRDDVVPKDAGPSAVRRVGDMLVAELSRTLEQLSARQREDMASL